MTVADTDEGAFAGLTRKLRRERDYTQQQVADRLRALGVDVTPQAVSYWEGGSRTPDDRKTIAALDEVLEADGRLLGALGYRVGREPSFDEWRASVEERLDRIMQMLDDLTAGRRRPKRR